MIALRVTYHGELHAEVFPMFKRAVRMSLLACAVVFSISHAESQNVSNYRKAQIAANEASAVGSLRVLQIACATYKDKYGQGSFPLELSDLRRANLIDSTLATGKKSGYVFTYTGGWTDLPGGEVAASFSVYADPVQDSVTGVRHFFVNQSGAIRFETGGPVTTKSPTLK
jgi:type IV pilus assembly protein PilA